MIPEPVGSPLWAAVKGFYDSWPPDNEDNAHALADVLKNLAGAASEANTNLSNTAQAVRRSWHDEAGEVMTDKTIANAREWVTINGAAQRLGGMAEQYAADLIAVKHIIIDTIARNEPQYIELLVKMHTRVQAAQLASQLADYLRRLVGGEKPAARNKGGGLLIEDNANVIAAVSDVLADLSTMVGAAGDVLGFIPTPVTLGLDPVLNVAGIGLQGLALGGHVLAGKAGADVSDFTIAMDVYGLASGAVGAVPGPAGPIFDAGGLGFQGGVELGSDGQTPTFWGDLGDYWVPKNPVQAGLYAAGAGIPGIGLAVPFWNAIEQGHQKDVEAREGGG